MTVRDEPCRGQELTGSRTHAGAEFRKTCIRLMKERVENEVRKLG